MKRRMRMRKIPANYIEEIPLPLMKIRKVGNSLVYTIPNGVVLKYNIKSGDKVFALLLRRKKRVSYEVKDDEKVVILSKNEAEQFEKFKKNQQKNQQGQY